MTGTPAFVFAGDHLLNVDKQLLVLPGLITDGGAGLDVGLFRSFFFFFLYSPSATMFPHLSFHTVLITRSEMCVWSVARGLVVTLRCRVVCRFKTLSADCVDMTEAAGLW